MRFVLSPPEKANKGVPSGPILGVEGACDGLVLDGFIFDGSTYNSYTDNGDLDVGRFAERAAQGRGGRPRVLGSVHVLPPAPAGQGDGPQRPFLG